MKSEKKNCKKNMYIYIYSFTSLDLFNSCIFSSICNFESVYLALISTIGHPKPHIFFVLKYTFTNFILNMSFYKMIINFAYRKVRHTLKSYIYTFRRPASTAYISSWTNRTGILHISFSSSWRILSSLLTCVYDYSIEPFEKKNK